MDRKSLLIIGISAAFLFAWYPLVNKLYPPTPLPPATNLVTTATNAAGKVIHSTNLVAATTLAPAATQAIVPPVNEELVVLETSEARYTFTSAGGGLKQVELKEFPARVGRGAKKDGKGATLNTKAPNPAFLVRGAAEIIGDGRFALTKDGDTVTARKDLPNGLTLVKEFRSSSNLLVKTVIRWENRTGNPVKLPAFQTVIGTATPMGFKDESLALGFEWYNGSKAERLKDGWFENKTFLIGGTPRAEYTGGASNVVWGAVNNQFFAMIAVPEVSAPSLVGHRLDLPPPSAEDIKDISKPMLKPRGYEAAFAYAESIVPPGQSLVQKYDLYAGPKEYKTLSRLERNVDLVMGFDGLTGPVAKGLLLSLNAIHSVGLGYGYAIIVITIIIKLLFWPLTSASTKSMKRMSALQPQMKELQERYKDDPKKLNTKMMEFMKENKLNPVGGCLPLLLQIPVFFGFNSMLQSAIELRGATFLWALDLSQPDTIFAIADFPVNPLPLCMGATMLWQANLTPPSPGMDPAQQKIMKYMPLVFLVFLYNYSSGLCLYWTVQNIFSILQMKITMARKDDDVVKAPTAPVRRK